MAPLSRLTRRPIRRRSWVVAIALAVASVAALAAAVFVPVESQTREISLSNQTSSATNLSLPPSVWVTVEFHHTGAMPMMYEMDQPGGGPMFHHPGMMEGDSYSFWSNGGTFECWVGVDHAGMGPAHIWVNATWGLI